MRSAAAVDAPASRAGTLQSLGPDLWNRTYYPTGADANPHIKPWYVVDAEGQTLGRLATMVAMHLRCVRARFTFASPDSTQLYDASVSSYRTRASC